MQRYYKTVVDRLGNAQPFARIAVYLADSPTTLANLYAADSLAVPKPNPFTTGDDGIADFFAPDGDYIVESRDQDETLVGTDPRVQLFDKDSTLKRANNLADVPDKAAARQNLGVPSTESVNAAVTAAAASAAAAAGSATAAQAAADAAEQHSLTAGAAAASAQQDAAAAHVDRLAAGVSAAAAHADRLAADASATQASLDAAAAHDDRLAADADAAQTAADRAATHADRLAADADAAQTASDRLATGADRAAVAADKVAVSADRAAADTAAADAQASAGAAAASELASANNAASANTSANSAATSATAAAGNATLAANSADRSREWAERAYGSDIPGFAGHFSSLHWAEVARMFASSPEDTQVAGFPGEYSAFHWAKKAEGFADDADEYLAASSAAAAAAADSAEDAEDSAGMAETARQLAQDFAQHPEDVQVPGYPGSYSAFHWAKKAEEFFQAIQPLSAISRGRSTAHAIPGDGAWHSIPLDVSVFQDGDNWSYDAVNARIIPNLASQERLITMLSATFAANANGTLRGLRVIARNPANLAEFVVPLERERAPSATLPVGIEISNITLPPKNWYLELQARHDYAILGIPQPISVTGCFLTVSLARGARGPAGDTVIVGDAQSSLKVQRYNNVSDGRTQLQVTDFALTKTDVVMLIRGDRVYLPPDFTVTLRGMPSAPDVVTMVDPASSDPADPDDFAVVVMEAAVGQDATVTVASTSTVPPGSSAAVLQSGTPSSRVLTFLIPAGHNGWSPVLALVADGSRQVMQVVDWTGGSGTKPPIGDYIGTTGLVGLIEEAVDLRGAEGLEGNDGWSPILAVVPDGSRSVLRVVNWTGGEGAKPATGSYIGPTGLVATAAAATDVRGADGSNGWSPTLAVVQDGSRYVFQVQDWTGGSGIKPGTGSYVGATGLTNDISQAVNVRGATGAAGAGLNNRGAWLNTGVYAPLDTVASGGVAYVCYLAVGPSAVAPALDGTHWASLGAQGAKGDDGDPGDPGEKGWSPILAVITDGSRRVHQVLDWTGGAGAKPATGSYIGATGLVADIALAVDVRGAAGATVNGWSPVLAVAIDGPRRVFQVIDWTGGNGVKPATGSYVGSTGLVAAIADGVDVRGPSGITGSGVPAGGTTGQALKKASNADNDTVWATLHEVPAGGTTGQLLRKVDATDHNAAWRDLIVAADIGTPARGYNVAFQPDANRPVHCEYVNTLLAIAGIAGNASESYVELRCDPTNPPTTVRDKARNRTSGVASVSQTMDMKVSWDVPAGWYVLLVPGGSGNHTETITAIQTERKA